VLLNLVDKARDAMPSGGSLRIRTRNARLDADAARSHPESRPGDYVAVEVSDTGCGMTPDVLARLFEPFFTTKPQGAGTGLGLAMCYGIVKQADGHILVESEPGRGSRFTVLLPRQPAGASPVEPGARPLSRGGSETVLLVEDDATVRELTARVLRETGYAVLAAGDAAEAIDCVERHAGRIDLLLTDVVMPGGSGHELAETLRARDARLAVLYMSGYTPDFVLRKGLAQDSVAFLAKPFTDAALVDAVRRALDARAPA
jgi:CheY-like chemotaxis protein